MFLSTQAHDANFGKFLLLSCSCMPAAAQCAVSAAAKAEGGRDPDGVLLLHNVLHLGRPTVRALLVCYLGHYPSPAASVST